MKTFTVGAKVFCDFTFGGKPKGVVIEVLRPGNGQRDDGRVKVKLTETQGAYKRGEIVEVGTFTAVPREMELSRKTGQIFRRVSTQYQYI
jgi:hypothetical protein